MVLVEKKLFQEYEWNWIMYLVKTYSKSTTIELLLSANGLGDLKWQFNFLSNQSFKIKLNLEEYSSLVLDFKEETYNIYYKQQKLTSGLMSLEALKIGMLRIYEYYFGTYINKETAIIPSDNHVFSKILANNCLRYTI